MSDFYKKMEQYGKHGKYPFHMPGHKRNPAVVEGHFPLEMDITEIDGFDNLHHAVGILREAQEKAARLFGAKETFFSVNGSTAALLSAVSACVSRRGKIIVARNCHKAVYHAMYIRDLSPVYVYPKKSKELSVNGCIEPEAIQKALLDNPDAQAVLITSPTYDGVVSDVEKIAKITHECGIPLIVDEAHGAHFCFSDYFPKSAVELGADLVIQSVHKTLPSMTQTALLHRCTDLADREKLAQFMGMYQSSSPSYILMASIDACVDKIQREGEGMFSEFTENLRAARNRLLKLRHIQLVTPEQLKAFGAFAYDCSKMIFSVRNTELTGHDFSEILRREYHIELEMEAEAYALALCSVGDTKEGMERLCSAVEEIDSRESLKNKKKKPLPKELSEARPVCKKSIAEAMDAGSETIFLDDSMGRVSADFVYLYPPGIPLLVPGEQITGHFIGNMRRYREQGLSLQGMKDVTGRTIRVTKE